MKNKILTMAIVKLRWMYFHVNPMYVKFYADSERTQVHFQHKRTGRIYSNYRWVDSKSTCV